MDGGIVQFIVNRRPPPVLDGVLDRSDDNDDDQRYSRKAGIVYTKDGKELPRSARKPHQRREVTHPKNNDKEEIDIGNIVELEPQVLGHETEGRVFGRSYLVAGVVCEWVAFWIALFLGGAYLITLGVIL